LFVAIEATAPRRFDLARDGRYSLHALPPPLGPEYDEFEFNVTGKARRVSDPLTLEAIGDAERARGRSGPKPDDWVFELDISAALTSTWNHKMGLVGERWLPTPSNGSRATRDVWSAGRR
jgi:hypothetical protein